MLPINFKASWASRHQNSKSRNCHEIEQTYKNSKNNHSKHKKKIYTQKIQRIEGKDGQLWRRLTRTATVVFENLLAWANNFFKAHFFLFVMFDMMLDDIFVWHEAVM